MSVTHGNTTRNSIANAVDDDVNAGTGRSGGVAVIYAGSQELVSILLQDPAFGAASGGVITLNGTPSNTASATGTADSFEVRSKDDDLVYSGSVTATGGGGDMELDNTSINSGQTVQIDSATYTAPV